MCRSSLLDSLKEALITSAVIATPPVLQVNETQLANIDFRLAQQLAAVTMRCRMPEPQRRPTEVLQRAADQLHCTDASSEGGTRTQYLRGPCCA